MLRLPLHAADHGLGAVDAVGGGQTDLVLLHQHHGKGLAEVGVGGVAGVAGLVVGAGRAEAQQLAAGDRDLDHAALEGLDGAVLVGVGESVLIASL